MARTARLGYTRSMNRRDSIIYKVSMLLLAAELLVTIFTILLKSVSDRYLLVSGIIILVTMACTVYGFVRKQKERRG